MSNSKNNWYVDLKADGQLHNEFYAFDALTTLLLKEGVRLDKSVHQCHLSKWTTNDGVVKYKKYVESNFKPLWLQYSSKNQDKRCPLFLSENGLLFSSYSWTGAAREHWNVNCNLLSFEKDDANDMAALLEKLPTFPPPPQQPDGTVYVLTESMGTICISEIGMGGEAIQRENYMPEVIESVDFITKDFRAVNPQGRLVIFDGPPGTGKTHLVRGLMSELREMQFIIVPPHFVHKLAEPEVIGALAGQSTNVGAMVLVLEDADQCLSKRKAENMNAISSVLNLSDGILGSVMNLRILATTNTDIAEFDSALTRKGRISRYVKIGHLDQERSEKIWKRLTSNDKMPLFKENRLSSIYSAAKEYCDTNKIQINIPASETKDLNSSSEEEDFDG